MAIGRDFRLPSPNGNQKKFPNVRLLASDNQAFSKSIAHLMRFGYFLVFRAVRYSKFNFSISLDK